MHLRCLFHCAVEVTKLTNSQALDLSKAKGETALCKEQKLLAEERIASAAVSKQLNPGPGPPKEPGVTARVSESGELALAQLLGAPGPGPLYFSGYQQYPQYTSGLVGPHAQLPVGQSIMPVGATQHSAEASMLLVRGPHGQLMWLPQPPPPAPLPVLYPGRGQPMVNRDGAQYPASGLQIVGHTGTQSTVCPSIMGAMIQVYGPHGQIMWLPVPQPPHSGGGPNHLQEDPDALRTAGAAGTATPGPLPLADAATAAEIATSGPLPLADAATESKPLDPGSITVNPSSSGAAAPAVAVALCQWPQMPPLAPRPLAPRPLAYQYPGPMNYYFPGQPYY